jgi:hypothetical protein
MLFEPANLSIIEQENEPVAVAITVDISGWLELHPSYLSPTTLSIPPPLATCELIEPILHRTALIRAAREHLEFRRRL